MSEREERWVNAGGIGIELWILEDTSDTEVDALNERLLNEVEALRQRMDESSPAWVRYDVEQY